MALRVKEIDVGGRKVQIANLLLRPHREFQEALDVLVEGKTDPGKGLARIAELKKTVVLAALTRAGSALTRDQFEDIFDGEDLEELFMAVMAWTGERPGKKPEKPADPPPSP